MALSMNEQLNKYYYRTLHRLDGNDLIACQTVGSLRTGNVVIFFASLVSIIEHSRRMGLVNTHNSESREGLRSLVAKNRLTGSQGLVSAR